MKNVVRVQNFSGKEKADLMRGKDTRDVKLTLYREFNKEGKHCLGSVDVFLYSEMDDVTMQSLIRKHINQHFTRIIRIMNFHQAAEHVKIILMR